MGSLLLVDGSISEELKELGFVDNINCIFCNKDNLEDQMRWILSAENRDKVDSMRKLGMELVRSKHNTKERSIEFNEYILSRDK